MKIFELYFNPKAEEDKFFDSFIYEPVKSYEKKLGTLCAAGELKNAIYQNSNFLKKIANNIKENYYNISYNNPEKAISQSLKKINEFLSEELKKDNISWLGNLNFALCSIKDYDLIFTKTGDIKIILIRNGKIIEIDKNLDSSEIEPYPLKVFLNIASGKLLENDLIFIITRDLYNFFLKENIFRKISQYEFLNEKRVKNILSSAVLKNKNKISGVCLLIILNPKNEKEESFKEIFFKKNSFFSKSFLKKIDFLKKEKKGNKRKKTKEKKKNKKKLKSFKNYKKILKNQQKYKKIIIILLLVFIFFLGIILF
ncbi:MAG: hypothetical protein PHO28_00035 [Candidatus Pacebacteria bacterium]|nr:hypothetical protein [Candidatus Paceibacterota bacterium]